MPPPFHSPFLALSGPWSVRPLMSAAGRSGLTPVGRAPQGDGSGKEISLALDVRLFHDPPVFLILAADQLAKIRAADTGRIEPEHGELVAHRRHFQRIGEPFFELRDRLLRRSGRHHGAEPDLDVVARIAEL